MDTSWAANIILLFIIIKVLYHLTLVAALYCF